MEILFSKNQTKMLFSHFSSVRVNFKRNKNFSFQKTFLFFSESAACLSPTQYKKCWNEILTSVYKYKNKTDNFKTEQT